MGRHETGMTLNMNNIRKATLKDVKHIQSLVNFYAAKDLMIARSLNELYENIRDFWVYTHAGKIIGCAGLHVTGWQDMAEIKSLAVDRARHKKGIGSQLVAQCITEAKALGVKQVFCLTYSPKFFMKLGFAKINKSRLPQKIWVECCNCPKFPDCKEVALIKKI